VNILLDTHIAVIAITAPELLSAREAAVLQDPDRVPFVSLASAWEIAIKNALPRPRQAFPFSAERALSLFRESGFEILPIAENHIVALESLPLHDGDSFDRLLVAQSIADRLMLLTRDAKIARYFEGQ
jgi:PIN domain nuclease of toxin-antitoxin system